MATWDHQEWRSESVLPGADELYKVYAALLSDPPLSHPDGNVKYVIVDTTLSAGEILSGTLFPKETGSPGGCPSFGSLHPESLKEIRADFERRKNERIHLEHIIPIPKAYVLMSESRANSFPGWGAPLTAPADKSDFTGVQDVIRLSNVFFDRKRAFAMVYMSAKCGGVLCGKFGWNVLERLPNGSWHIDTRDYCYKVVA